MERLPAPYAGRCARNWMSHDASAMTRAMSSLASAVFAAADAVRGLSAAYSSLPKEVRDALQ